METEVKKGKDGNAAGRDEVTGNMVERGGRGELVIDLVWKLCNIEFESCVLLDD